jgi:phosphoglycerate-specific signal transduction histidine kinase
MSNSGKNQADTETILMALDQISQTIEVMTSVVGRLRSYMRQQETAALEKSRELDAEPQPDHIIH